jgi:hypothetical protein
MVYRFRAMSYTQLISRETLGTFLLPLTTYDDLHVLDSGSDLVASTKGMGTFGGWTGSLHGSPYYKCGCVARTEGSCGYYGTRGRQRWLFVWIIPKNNPLAQVIDGCGLWLKGPLTSPPHFFSPANIGQLEGFQSDTFLHLEILHLCVTLSWCYFLPQSL